MIDDGTKALKKLHDQVHTRAQQRLDRQPYNRLHVLLTSLSGYDRGEVLKFCTALEGMAPDDRETAIRQNFGEQVLGRCRPALDQLRSMQL